MASLKRIFALIFLLSASMAALSFGIHRLTANNTLGGDYYICYLAGRAALSGENPYSDEIGIQVQLAMHKRLMGPQEDQLAFANPPFALLPQLPMIGLPFDWSQAVWMAFTLLAGMFLLLSASQDRPRLVILSLFVLYPYAFGVILGNHAVLIFPILAWMFSRMMQPAANSRLIQIIAGMMLAWCLAKPQFSLVFCLFLLLLALKRKERLFLVSFSLSILLYLAFSFILVPGWPALWLDRLQKYATYNQTWLISEFLFRQFLPAQSASVLSLVLLIIVAVCGLLVLQRWYRGRFSTLLVWGFCGLAAFLIHPRGKSYEHLVFLLPILSWLLLRPSRKLLPPIFFWGGSIVLSWLAFILQRDPSFPASAAEAPFALLAIWMLWMLTRPSGELPAEPLIKSGIIIPYGSPRTDPVDG